MRTEIIPGGSRYVLPFRKSRELKTVGMVALVIGLLATAFMIFWMAGPIRMAMRETSPVRWFLFAFGLAGLFGLIPALGILLGGLAALSGRSRAEVEVASGDLRLTERLGVFRWSWTRRLTDVSHVAVHEGLSGGLPSRRGESGQEPTPSHLGTIAVSAPGRSDLAVGMGYPLTLLRPFAAQLAATMNTKVATATRAASPSTPGIALLDPLEASRRQEELLVQHPPETDIVKQDLADGVAFAVPPAGLWRGSHGLFLFAIIWITFVTFFAVVSLVGAKTLREPVLLAFLSAFFAVGFAILTAAVNMGRRHALLAVTGRILTVRQIGIFGVREWRLDAAAVSDVRMGPSGMEVNDRPVMELQVFPAGGRKIGILSQRKEDELLWMAAVLRSALRIHEQTPRAPTAGSLSTQSKSIVTL